jgi:acylphosphatase
MKRLHFIVTGRVQGVGFRYYCHEAAVRLGIGGYARNLADGSVEIEAEGDDAAVEEFAETVARGPRASKVETVVREESEVKGERSFSVR